MSTNEIIWLDVIEEFAEYLNTIKYDYNDITDVVKYITNIEAIPNDGLKYFVKLDENNDTLNTILSYSTEGIELIRYKPVYKDRIIFTDTDSEIPNYIFQDYTSWIAGVKTERTIQREQGEKYNNTIIGNEGITLYQTTLTADSIVTAPSLNLGLGNESDLNGFNRTNQPKNLKSFILSMIITTANEDLFNDSTPFKTFYAMEKKIVELWGDYLNYCGVAPYKDLITGSKIGGKMVNDVTYPGQIIYQLTNTINYR